MAIYLCILICIVYAAIALTKEKQIINPLTIFCTLWGGIIWLSSLGLYGLYPTSEDTYWIFFGGILSFGIAYFIYRFLLGKYSFILCYEGRVLGYDYRKTYVPRYRLLQILALICCIYYLIEFFSVAKYLFLDNSMEIIRNFASDSTQKSSLENAIVSLFLGPLTMVLPTIVAIDFWFGKKNKKLFIIICILVVLRTLTDGGRATILYFFLHFIIAFMFFKKKEQKMLQVFKEKKSKKKLIVILISLVVGIFVIQVTLSRSGIKPLRTLYYYFAMEPYMFETWANEVNNLNLTAYGLASTNGFWFAFFYIIKNIFGIANYPEFWENINMVISQTDEVWKMISTEIMSANAYVSLFWFLYLDGRQLGVLLGMFIYGLISAYTYSSAIAYFSPRAICIYSFILQGLIFSFVRLQFSNIYYAIAFIFILFIAYRPISSLEGEA